MKSENQNLASDTVSIIRNLVGNTYNNTVFKVTSALGDVFRRRDVVIELSEINSVEADVLKYWTPFSFTHSRLTKQILETRIELTKHVYEEADKYCGSDRLTCIGNGCIDEGSIMVVGMTAGFRNANVFDDISFPYKFSFYFGDTSFLLREGFCDLLHRMYFTNIGKYSFSRDVMENDDMYTKTYDDCLSVLAREIRCIKPKLIIAAGNQVYEFMQAHGINCYKITHPSYFLFKRKIDAGLEYYTKQTSYIKGEFLCT